MQADVEERVLKMWDSKLNMYLNEEYRREMMRQADRERQAEEARNDREKSTLRSLASARLSAMVNNRRDRYEARANVQPQSVADTGTFPQIA